MPRENATQENAAADAPQTEELLQLADELADNLVAAAAPLHFAVAQSPSELEAIFRLRYQVIVERGWAKPEDLPDGLERDAYDDLAIHIAAWDGDTLAASSRIVLPTPDLLLPTERTFEVKIEPHGQVVDMGRQLVARTYSNLQHQVFAALLGKTWLEMHVRGFTRVCGDFTPAVTRLHRLLGFQVMQVGPARQFWGEERFPIVVDIVGSVPTLVKRWSRFMRQET